MTLKKWNKKYLWLTIPLVYSVFMLGYQRDWFFASVDHLFFQVVSTQANQTSDKYPSSFGSILIGIQSSSKWVASLAYTFLFSLHAAALVLCMYRNVRFVAYTFVTYLVLSLFCFLLILLGNLFNSYTLGYGLAQHLKYLMQSPFLIGFLLMGFHFAQTLAEKNS
jgi:hypothetical protein